MWYNVIVQKQTPQEHYTAYQLKLPVEIEKIIEISDPVYSFSEVMDHIDLNKYLTIEERRPGRLRYDQKTLLKIILFAFMENGYATVREIEKCCKCKGNRIVRLNEELTQFHAEVLNNLNSIHGALLRMNRSIQSEGTFGTIKWNRSYIRARRRGLRSLFLEFGMISCGFNLHKFHLKKVALRSAA